MTGSMARKEPPAKGRGCASETVGQKQYLFTNSDLKRLIAPLIVEQILAVTVGMVDTMMVSFTIRGWRFMSALDGFTGTAV